MRPIHMIGLLLWRGGILLVAATLLFEGARALMRLIDVPDQLAIGYALSLAGVLVVIASLILERIQDRRAEGDLTE